VTWLITGAGGQLGSVVLAELTRRGESALGVASPSGPLPLEGAVERADLTDGHAMVRLLDQARARFVVHAGAIASVAVALADPARALAVNASAAAALAGAAHQRGARFVYVSTDMVFDGERAPYTERDVASPLSAYGRSKLEGERAVLSVAPVLVARLPLLYGLPTVNRDTTFITQVRALLRRESLTLFQDEWRTPLALEDAARALIRCAESDLPGVVHLGGPERLSRLAMGERLAAALGVDGATLHAVLRESAPAPEPRARDLSLDSSKYRAHFGVPVGRPMDEALAETDWSSFE
jgi:dTDP-4-dehydrorhamnose reductase